jgi:hypothetical protein
MQKNADHCGNARGAKNRGMSLMRGVAKAQSSAADLPRTRQKLFPHKALAPATVDRRQKRKGKQTDYEAMNKVRPLRLTRSSGLLPALRTALWNSETLFTGWRLTC